MNLLVLSDHPLRAELTNEVHARPFAQLVAPERASYLALLHDEPDEAGDRGHLEALCGRYGLAGPTVGQNHMIADFGDFRLKWERHTEFTTYTVFLAGNSAQGPFAEPALAAVSEDWLAGLPGSVMVAVHAELTPGGAATSGGADHSKHFEHEVFAGSLVSGGAAEVWMDFAMNRDGFGRALVIDRDLKPSQAGRLIQRLFEIETYRVMALLGLPLARDGTPILNGVNKRMLTITQRMAQPGGMDDDRALLDEISGISMEIERVAARSGFRFGASRAYYALVRRRIVELREERVEGLQTIDEFMDRRLAPAMRTCEAVAERIDRMSRRLARASDLLRTRVDIQLEAQNRDLLRSMNRRAALQLRLQETVEGLSVAAITYYVVGLVGYSLKAITEAGVTLPTDILTALAIPIVAGVAWYGVRRIRRMVASRSEHADV